MFHALVLICSMMTPPEGCTRETAYDVIVGQPAATPQACLMRGQEKVAQTVLSDPRVYTKIVCEK